VNEKSEKITKEIGYCRYGRKSISLAWPVFIDAQLYPIVRKIPVRENGVDTLGVKNIPVPYGALIIYQTLFAELDDGNPRISKSWIFESKEWNFSNLMFEFDIPVGLNWLISGIIDHERRYS
jgi:hypothetical protein